MMSVPTRVVPVFGSIPEQVLKMRPFTSSLLLVINRAFFNLYLHRIRYKYQHGETLQGVAARGLT
jgi:hypothetical protein